MASTPKAGNFPTDSSAQAGKFPTQGTSVGNSVVNRSAQSGGTAVGKGGVQSTGGMLAAVTAVHTPNIQEPLGASLHPSASLYAQNAPAASEQLRNVRIIPSAIGNRDFYLRRQYNQGV